VVPFTLGAMRAWGGQLGPAIRRETVDALTLLGGGLRSAAARIRILLAPTPSPSVVSHGSACDYSLRPRFMATT